MARVMTPQDAHAIINAVAKEITGQDAALQAVDSSSFVSVGENVLSAGTENVLNALGLVLGRTLVAVRPYNAKLRLINSLDTGLFAHRMRKISYYSREALPSGAFNTQLFTNLADGFTNGKNPGTDGNARSTASMWEQNQPVPLEVNFAGSSTWQDSTTVYEKQLQQAFRDEASFNQFVGGILTEKANDIETQKEAFNRIALLNYIGAVYDMEANGTRVVNLTAAFNARYGTSYTSAQLRSTYLRDFLAYFVAEVKGYMEKLTIRQAANHWSPTKTVGDVNYTLLRHTPYDKQRLFLYAPLFREAEAMVLPEIFRPEYLKIDKQYEGVEFWQNPNDPSAVSVTPAIPNVETPSAGQIAGSAVNIPYVVGLLFDEDGLMVDYQLDAATSTPIEARKHYRNLWWTFAKNAINDLTENAVLFIMQDTD